MVTLKCVKAYLAFSRSAFRLKVQGPLFSNEKNTDLSLRSTRSLSCTGCFKKRSFETTRAWNAPWNSDSKFWKLRGDFEGKFRKNFKRGNVLRIDAGNYFSVKVPGEDIGSFRIVGNICESVTDADKMFNSVFYGIRYPTIWKLAFFF